MTSGGTEDTPAANTLLEQMGGWRGLVQSTIPVAVFVPVNSFFGLTAAVCAALAAAIAILIWSLARRATIQPAISGVMGVALCSFIAYRTGEAKGYFLFGIYTSLAYGAVLALSILVRYPLVGVIWNLLNGRDSRWRSVPAARRAYDIATAVWVLVFAARYLVQSGLYEDDRVGWLGFARIAMGYPLAAVAVLVCIWAVRRADRALADQPEVVVEDEHAADESAAPPVAASDPNEQEHSSAMDGVTRRE